MTKFFLPNGSFIKSSLLSGGNTQPPAFIPVTKTAPALQWETVADALITQDSSYFLLESGERILLHA